MIKDRIIQVIDYKGIAKESFFEKIGMTSANFRGNARKTPLNSTAIENILSELPDINLEWLIMGKGEMLKQKEGENLAISNVRKLTTDRKRTTQMVPLYEIEATAGIFELLGDNAKKKHIPIDYISIPNLPKCDGALPITGDSMYPLLKSGDIALYKEVHDLNNIIWGEMYLVALSHNGDDFFFAKYLQKSEQDGYVKLVSHNHNHQSKDFPLQSIRALALIKASVRINTQF